MQIAAMANNVHWIAKAFHCDILLHSGVIPIIMDSNANITASIISQRMQA